MSEFGRVLCVCVLTRKDERKTNVVKYPIESELPHSKSFLPEFGSQRAPDLHASIMFCQLSPVAHLQQPLLPLKHLLTYHPPTKIFISVSDPKFTN